MHIQSPVYQEADQIKQLVDSAERIVVVQANNPDGDSMGSALALEEILGDMGKQVWLYCGITVPTYLRYLNGWDRVVQDIPSNFDLSIIVDTSANTLLKDLTTEHNGQVLKSKPCIVLDHHPVDSSIAFATVLCNQPAVATGEVIYELSQQLGWELNHTAKQRLATAIMADSLGLTTEATTARSIAIISELVAGGVSIAELEQARRELMRKKQEHVRYKGELLQRVEYHDNGRIATVTIPWEEIEQYSSDYNPSMLVLDDMRMTIGTGIAIAFKTYKGNKMTAKIRCNYGTPIANELAQHFGGGGHSYASGFKIVDGKPFNEIKSECLSYAAELLDKLDRNKESSDETLQHTDS